MGKVSNRLKVTTIQTRGVVVAGPSDVIPDPEKEH